MGPKKSEPPPQSDESDDEYDAPKKSKNKKSPVKKPAAKPSKKAKQHNPDDPLPEANVDMDNEDDPNEDILSIPIPTMRNANQHEEEPTRLVIQQIVVNNFKSYHGESVIGPFHKSFTSIIGPNGSGKSNVIDSLLFVFGYRSGRIRCKKVSNLIHSSKGRKCDSCTVSIVFQRIEDVNETECNLVPNSKFIISRTGYQNNSSHYAIDGKTVPYKEVEARLKRENIDIEHNRFLILQGEVEQIALMKPKAPSKSEDGMLEYLEDIIGTNIYVPLIRKFDARLNRVLIDLSQQKIKKGHAKDAKTAVEPTARAACDFLSTENKMTQLRSKLEQKKRQQQQDKLQPMLEIIEKEKQEYEGMKEQLTSTKQGSQDIDKQESRLTKEKASADNAIDELKQQITDEANEEKKRVQRIKACKTDLEKLEKDINSEEEKKTKLIDGPAKAEKKIEKLRSEAENLREIEATAMQQSKDNQPLFSEKKSEIEPEKIEAEREFAEMNAKFNDVKSRATIAEAEIEDLIKMRDSGKIRLEQLNKRMEESVKTLEEQTKELEQLEPKFETDSRRLAEIMKELPNKKAEVSNIDKNIRSIRERITSIENERVTAMRGNQIDQCFSAMRDEGTLKGYIGSLSDLCAIDPLYDKAISNNWGQSSFILTEDYQTAKDCINILHAKKLGRKSFISIEKCNIEVRKSQMDAPPSSFPAPRLFDLLKFDPKYRTAFYFSLRDLLYAKDIQTAQRIWRESGRQHTIACGDGSCVNSNGSLTGGGRIYTGVIPTEIRNKRASTSNNDARELTDLKKEYDNLMSTFPEMKKEAEDMDREMFGLRPNVENMRKRVAALKLSVEDSKQKTKQLKSTIKTAEEEAEKVNVDEEEIKKKEKIVAKLIRERDEARDRAESSQKLVKEATEKIDAIYDELVKNFDKEAADARARIKKCEAEIAKQNAVITNSGRNIEKCDNAIENIRKQLEKKQKHLEELEEVVQNDEEGNEKKEKLKAMEEERKQMDGRFKELREEKSRLENEVMELEKKLKEKKAEIRGHEETYEVRRERIKKCEEQLRKLKLNRVPQLFNKDVLRPEDLEMELEQEIDPETLKDMTPDEVAKMKKGLAHEYSEKVYTMEYQMRREADNELDNVGEEASNVERFQEFTAEELRNLTKEDIEHIEFKIKCAQQELDSAKATVDLTSIEDFVRKAQKYNEETTKTIELENLYRKYRSRANELKTLRETQFLQAYTFIKKKLETVYAMLTDGGMAQFVGENNPQSIFEEGVVFKVRPPRKSWKNVENLSGGEKTLSSLALIFALHEYRPTPFYVMDEIDAALDYRNVSIIGEYVRERNQGAQSIIISLRNNMFELADRLVGIYKVDDCTRNVAIDPLDICQKAKVLAGALGLQVRTMPDEITALFTEQQAESNRELTTREKQYENFPSTSEINRAERIVGIESKVRKQINQTTNETTHAAGGTTSVAQPRPISQASNRAESRMIERHNFPTVRLVARQTQSPQRRRETQDQPTTSAQQSNGEEQNVLRDVDTNVDEEEAEVEVEPASEPPIKRAHVVNEEEDNDITDITDQQ